MKLLARSLRPIRRTATARVMSPILAALALCHGAAAQCDAWSSFGNAGFHNSAVRALTTYNGEIVAGGYFIDAANTGRHTRVNRVARWDGAAWQPLASGGEIGLGGSSVRALGAFRGDLIAAGDFQTAGGQTVHRIARWDGAAWHPLTSNGHVGLPNLVYAVAEYQNDLFVGGEFTSAGGQTVNHIARWDGSAWHPLLDGSAPGTTGRVTDLVVHEGQLVLAGNFPWAGGSTAHSIVRWNGANWSRFVVGPNIGLGPSQSATAVCVWRGDLVVGGSFTWLGTVLTHRLARWNAGQWHAFSAGGAPGVSGVCEALIEHDGDLIIAGSMPTTVDGLTVNRILRWDGAAWRTFVGGGQTGVNLTARAALSHEGQLIVAGDFTTAGGMFVQGIARWNSCASYTYCTAGVSGGGCAAAISSTGAASATAGSGFTIDVGALDGQRLGLILYGVDNAGFAPAPWGASASWLCVKGPHQRTPSQSSGGTAGACDGAFSLDWNAYIAAGPSVLGHPFAVGQRIFAQGWFRDPPSPKGTSLSDALGFAVQP